MNKSIISFVVVFLSILIFHSCKMDLNKSQGNRTKKFDGSYIISFICDKVCMANSTIDIKNGYIDGNIIQNIKQQSFHVTGYVKNDGKISFKTISTDLKEPVDAVGIIDSNGSIKGNYSVGNRECKFIGFCFTKNKNEKITQYDGSYQLELIRDGNRIASFKARIKDGKFNTILTTINYESYKIDGRISKDGSIILNTMFSNNNKGITVTGYINEDGSIKGIYYTYSGKTGVFSGKKMSDN